MLNKKLWYVKRGETLAGPFPKAVIERHLVLGRIRPDDLLCNDCEHWLPPLEIAEFAAFKQGRATGKPFALYDERQQERRRGTREKGVQFAGPRARSPPARTGRDSPRKG